MIDEKYGRLYKTGDIEFFDAAGNIIFYGRRDTQERLVALVVYGTSGDPTAAITSLVPRKQKYIDEIRNHVRGRVPSALAPAIWLRISQVPLTIIGKTDVRKLASLVEASNHSRRPRRTVGRCVSGSHEIAGYKSTRRPLKR